MHLYTVTNYPYANMPEVYFLKARLCLSNLKIFQTPMYLSLCYFLGQKDLPRMRKKTL